MIEQYAFVSGDPKTRLSQSALARRASTRAAEWLESARGVGGVRDIRYGLEMLRDYWGLGTITAEEADRISSTFDILETGDALLDPTPEKTYTFAQVSKVKINRK